MGIPVKHLMNCMSEQLCAWTAKKSFHRRTHQYYPRVAREKHQAVLQLGHELIHVVLEGRENLSAISNLASQVGDFQRDQAIFVVPGFVPVKSLGVPSAHAIEVTADLLQGTQRQVGNSSCQKQGHKD